MDNKKTNDLQALNDASLDELMLSQNTGISVDVLSWIMKFLKYWYLFVIAVVIAFGLAFLKNKSWTPTYRTSTHLLIQDARATASRTDFTSGYQGLGMTGGRAYVNQMIMIKSYDFINRVVDRMDENYDIYTKHRFKNVNKYKSAPIRITSTYISGRAYAMEFKIKGIDENSFSISYEGESLSFWDRYVLKKQDIAEPFEIVAKYDEPFQHSFFFLTISKTDLFRDSSYELYVKFLSKPGLVASYLGRLGTSLLTEGSSVVEISVVGKVVQRDMDFLNLLNDEFAKQNLEFKNSSAERSIAFLDTQLGVIRDSIDSSENKLNTFQSATGLYTSNMTTTKSQQVTRLEEEQASLNLVKQYMSLLEEELAKPDGLLTDPSATNIPSPQLSSLVSQYNTLVRETRNMGPRNVLKASNQRQIEDIKTQIQGTLQTMNASSALKEADLVDRLNKARGEMANLPKNERAFLTHTRDFNLNNSYYNVLLQKRLESQLQKESNTADNTIIDAPRVKGIVNRDDTKNNYVLFLIIGLLIPAIFVLCKEILFKYSIQGREELERISKLPILGTIEHSKRNEFMAVKKFPRSSFAEGFRNLRSRMEFIAKREKPISMLVTSTEPKDGKTFIAVNMASIYHLASKKVVIVDFDLRRPMMSKSLGMEGRDGLSNYLISQVKLEDVTYRHKEFNIDVIPAGVTPPNPSELIRSDRTKELLAILQQKYDYVILDCSPVGLVSDAHFLARQVDVIMYVVRNEKTNRNFFKYTIRELLEDNVSNIVLIYNDVDIKTGYYGNRRYYGKSSYYLKHNSYYNNEEEGEAEDQPQAST
ncbi:polysaccharide biosynthesis tyrosine autokinase [Bacteroidales bacterium OttesenSCG-928-A17]|nr:polysaccharide biosynthesis tyrosine autokinase [Bacteroidales bacterium OttesenSCG-928-A17]